MRAIRLSKESLKMWRSPPHFVRESVSSELTDRCKRLLSARTPAQLSAAYERYKAKAAECMGSGSKSYSGTQIGFEHGPRFIGHGSNPRSESFTTSPLVYGPDETFAYVRFRLLPNFAVWHRVLEEVYALASNPKFDPTDMLDFGSGPGSAVLAARSVWNEEEGVSLKNAVLIDSSRAMRDAATALLHDVHRPTEVLQGLSDVRKGEEEPMFDLVTVGNTLSEMPSHAQRAAAAATLWRMVRPGGLLIVVEPGNALGSHTVRSVRKMLLEANDIESHEPHRTKKKIHRRKKESREMGEHYLAHVVGPCTHSQYCPLGARRACYFAHKVPKTGRGLFENAGLAPELFSWVAIRKVDKHVHEPEQPATIMAEQQQQQLWARLVKPSQKASKHTTLHVCTPDGQAGCSVISKRKWKHEPDVYSAARKSQLGGLFPWLKGMNLHDVQVNGKPIEFGIGKEAEEEDDEGVGGKEEDSDVENLMNGLSEEVGGMQAMLPSEGFISPRRAKLQRRRRAILGQMEDESIRRRNMGKYKLDNRLNQCVQDLELDLQEEENLHETVSAKCNTTPQRRMRLKRARRRRIFVR